MSRLPSPQAGSGRSDGYFAPNLIRPAAPQLPQRPSQVALAVDTSNDINATNRLLDSLFNLGETMWDRQKESIDAEEMLRVSKLSQEEVRNDLKKQAKAAEQSGLLAFGSNPYRRMVAMEYLAERVMRDDYSKELTANLSRFSNPLSEEDASVFARDTFEALNIQGGYAQQKATEMYNSMSSNWMAQVNSQKQSRMVSKNREDLRDASYHVFRELADGEINFAEAVERIDAHSDAFYELENSAGREYIVAGLVAAADNQAYDAEDAGAIDALQSTINQIRLQKTGGLALSESHLDKLDEIENRLNAKEKAMGKVTQEELRDDMQQVSIAVAKVLQEHGDNLETDQVWELALTELGDDVSEDAKALYYTQNLNDTVFGFQSDVARLSPTATNEIFDNFESLGSDLEARSQFIDTLDAPAQVKQTLRSNLRDMTILRNQELSLALRGTSVLSDMASNSGQEIYNQAGAGEVVDATEAAVLSSVRQTSPKEEASKAAEAAIKQGLTPEEAEQAAFEAHRAIDSVWDGIIIEGGSDYNLEAAREAAKMYPQIFTPSRLKTMEKVSQARAARDLNIPMGTDVPSGDSMDLQEGRLLAWDRDMRANIDDVRELHKQKQTPKRDEQIAAYNKKARTDAGAYFKEFDRLAILSARDLYKAEAAEKYLPETSISIAQRSPEEYIQASRLFGYSPENLRTGVDDRGVPLSINPDHKNPYKQLMIDPDTLISDLEALSKVADGLSPEELQQALPNNSIVEGYLAYRDLVGEEDAVSFNTGRDNFVSLQLRGIGAYTNPTIPTELRKALSSE